MAVISGLAVLGFGLWVGKQLFHDPTCDYWQRGMSPDEKVLAALTLANESWTLPFVNGTRDDGSVNTFSRNSVPYESSDEILSLNPECCDIFAGVRYRSGNSALKIIGEPNAPLEDGLEGAIVLRYPGQYRDRKSNQIVQKEIFKIVDFNKCN